MHLEKKQMRIQDLEIDLSDGVKLIALLEVLNNGPIEGRFYKNPKSKPYKIDNINFALNFITDTFEVKLIGCSAAGIFSIFLTDCFSVKFIFFIFFNFKIRYCGWKS